MQEYKREKAGLESRLNQMTKAAAHHDNHLRAIDAWFRQVSLGPSIIKIHPQTFEG
jgi:E3 ubiquitin-protein ligase BRE1